MCNFKVKIDKNKIEKILIIKLRGIGDVVLSTIIFDTIRKEFPNAEVDYLTERPSNQFLSNFDFINNILLLDRKSTLSRVKTAISIRNTKYDLVLDLFSNPTTAQITFTSGARYRAGFPYKGRKYAYNLFGPVERGKFHAAELHIEFLKSIGLQIHDKQLEYNLDKRDNYFAQNYLDSFTLDKSLLVGISPSGGWSSKRCPPKKFAEIADSIIEKFNAAVLLLWGPEDKSDVENIVKMMTNVAICAPDTTINQMASFINECDIFIANDSGPMHISAAVGTPTLSIHGPTSPMLQGPHGEKHEWVRLDELHCIECNLLDCPFNQECFNDLPIERILAKVELLLKKNKAE
jgi:lipopolysaccharide heptosyltransferase II